ncbi:SDR family NAD(P)-dependent oxidoreductase [Nitrincola sp.]|uniref:SDR family NAD(P)-dependent oxidoreductase n=1 Tax=Pseudomonadota TaxID=1224 RepID=UPI003A92C6D1
MTENISDKRAVVIVTGGTRGIGKCIVKRLHDDGYAILFTHSNSDASAIELANALHRPDHPCVGMKANATTLGIEKSIFDKAETLGDVVGVVNNAGITGTISKLAALEDESLSKIVAVNLVAPIRLCREAARRWNDRSSRSSIINISSVAARTGSPNEYVVYAATKAAIETLSIGLAKELAPRNIHVNAVSPGTVDTDIHTLAGEPGRAQRVAKNIPMGRPGRPEEIADAVAWLISDQATYVTGTVINVAGGL